MFLHDLLIAVIVSQFLTRLHCLQGILRKFIYIHAKTSSYTEYARKWIASVSWRLNFQKYSE